MSLQTPINTTEHHSAGQSPEVLSVDPDRIKMFALIAGANALVGRRRKALAGLLRVCATQAVEDGTIPDPSVGIVPGEILLLASTHDTYGPVLEGLLFGLPDEA